MKPWLYIVLTFGSVLLTAAFAIKALPLRSSLCEELASEPFTYKRDALSSRGCAESMAWQVPDIFFELRPLSGSFV
jgi:hypothetical protein